MYSQIIEENQYKLDFKRNPCRSDDVFNISAGISLNCRPFLKYLLFFKLNSVFTTISDNISDKVLL